MRRFLMLFVLVAACAPRGNLVVVPIEAVQGPIVPVFTASSRETDPDGQPGRNRAEILNIHRCQSQSLHARCFS